MKFNTTTVGGGVEILASKDFQAIPVKVATPGSGTVVKAGATVEYAILGENTVIGPGAVVGTAPDGTEGWGVATCGPNVTVSAGKVILAGAMIYSGEEG